jgi:hypothetical protein
VEQQPAIPGRADVRSEFRPPRAPPGFAQSRERILTLLIVAKPTGVAGMKALSSSEAVGDDPAVKRLSDFFEEFDSGLHVLVVFGCPDSKLCVSAR